MSTSDDRHGDSGIDAPLAEPEAGPARGDGIPVEEAVADGRGVRPVGSPRALRHFRPAGGGGPVRRFFYRQRDELTRDAILGVLLVIVAFGSAAWWDTRLDARQEALEERRNARAEVLENTRFLRQVAIDGAVVKPFTGLVLRGARLSRLNLGCDLEENRTPDERGCADLSDADLSCADRLGAAASTGEPQVSPTDPDVFCTDLSDAVLSGANLTRATLSGADLTRADLTGATLSSADLTEANLSQALLSNAVLPDADASDAVLTGADFFGALLARAVLADANLTGARLVRANLSGAVLTGADLPHANLNRADFRWADLVETDLSDADLTDANLSGTDLTGADLSGANLTVLCFDDQTLWPEGAAVPAADCSAWRDHGPPGPVKPFASGRRFASPTPDD